MFLLISIIRKKMQKKNVVVSEKKNLKKNVNEKNLIRAFGTIKPLNVELVPYKCNSQITYQKKAFVDFDVVICIPSYNRYEKVRRLISQLYQQPTRYTFKIILLNDGSSELDYDTLTTEFPEIIYMKNEIPNGKVLHWYCYNQMWENIRNIQCHTVLQMDDDFILCDNFLNIIIDLFFEIKEKNGNMMMISPHLWSFKKVNEERWWKRIDVVDGIALIDSDVIRYMEYKMKPVDVVAVSKPGAPVRTWSQICNAMKNMDGFIYRTEYSLVYHDGNNDSKLHGDVRKNNQRGVYTQKYIGKL